MYVCVPFMCCVFFVCVEHVFVCFLCFVFLFVCEHVFVCAVRMRGFCFMCLGLFVWGLRLGLFEVYSCA